MAPVAFVPEIQLYQADEATALWHLTEATLDRADMPPPFWAFAWAGGQGLARYILDHPEAVKAKRVLDFASGSGLVAIAAAKSGALSVEAVDIDPFAVAAIFLNAEVNEATIHARHDDVIGIPAGDFDVLLAGDVFYDSGFAARLMPWFAALSEAGVTVIAGDPDRTYRPVASVRELALYEVPVHLALEDAAMKRVRVLRFESLQTALPGGRGFA
ncbi:class I SAM-dependent methyltransferase [Kaistia terrae]|uniref:Class I SAM-dependent methyltransferase n=1 Tax=Kaistia terrae TaxID=537017 RepID=A0ABW0PZP0_9HYPH|nr:50S ribosomal protein L11 methyltransferase [Kaistia terrae]MCX5580915.1 50S ribosomal protein L11 methyltransferase [Kaistia terrae]